jgi:diguanylate cyclase (GGDEF)-like protein
LYPSERKRMTSVSKILIVDDDEQITKLLNFFLSSKGYECTTASNGKEALEKVHEEEFDFVITDIKMPEMDGILLTRELLRIRPDISVMVMTGFTSEYTEEDAMDTGANDFIKKPFTLAEFSARLQRIIRERNRLLDLQNLAFIDALTGLPNRNMFLDRASQAVAHGKRYNHPLALLFLDVDQFKGVNDMHGHDAGDLLLKGVASRLSESMRKTDTISRIAGDEFVVMTRVSRKEEAGFIASKILGILSPPFSLGEHSVSITCSIGISLFPIDADDVDSLIKKADSAMYQAKGKGGNNYQFYKNKVQTAAS